MQLYGDLCVHLHSMQHVHGVISLTGHIIGRPGVPLGSSGVFWKVRIVSPMGTHSSIWNSS